MGRADFAGLIVRYARKTYEGNSGQTGTGVASETTSITDQRGSAYEVFPGRLRVLQDHN